MKYRFGTESDLDLLAEWNYHLTQDEGHRNSMSVEQLRERMKAWLNGDYKAVLFHTGTTPVAYALYREDDKDIYVRQLFVDRKKRRHGIGKEAIVILKKEIWPIDKRLTVDVLTSNVPAVTYWRSVGFTDYSLTLEIIPTEIDE